MTSPKLKLFCSATIFVGKFLNIAILQIKIIITPKIRLIVVSLNLIYFSDSLRSIYLIQRRLGAENLELNLSYLRLNVNGGYVWSCFAGATGLDNFVIKIGYFNC